MVPAALFLRKKQELRGGNGNTNTVARAFHRPADGGGAGEIPRPVREEAYMQRPIRFTAAGDILITRRLPAAGDSALREAIAFETENSFQTYMD